MYGNDTGRTLEAAGHRLVANSTNSVMAHLSG